MNDVLMNNLANHTMAAVLTSLFLVGGLLVIRIILMKTIRRRSHILTKEQRRWMNQIKNGFFILLVFGLVMIWAPQLQTLALSLTAVAVAVVVATKEMILCLMGGVMRAATRPFKVGDWVSIDGASGEVTDINAFAFSLQEIDLAGRSYQFTGQTIEVPNSKFFTSAVENLTFMKAFVFIEQPITIPGTDIDPSLLFAELETIATKAFEPHKSAAGTFLRKVERKAGVDLPDPEPSISARTTDLGHLIFTVRMLVPTGQAHEIGPAILKDLLHFAFKQREAEKIRKEQAEAQK